LTSQIRSAHASIGANPAEGCARNCGTGLARFGTMARGSAELEYHLLLAKDLRFLPPSVTKAKNRRNIK
jgi:four helix bundle protein